MGGIMGRLFHEFAMTLTLAIVISAAVSLTLTPMMCAKFLKADRGVRHGRFHRASERAFNWLFSTYEASLSWVLPHARLTLSVAAITVCIDIYLFMVVPKGLPAASWAPSRRIRIRRFKRCSRSSPAS